MPDVDYGQCPLGDTSKQVGLRLALLDLQLASDTIAYHHFLELRGSPAPHPGHDSSGHYGGVVGAAPHPGGAADPRQGGHRRLGEWHWDLGAEA
jgi:hypothetical protein